MREKKQIEMKNDIKTLIINQNRTETGTVRRVQRKKYALKWKMNKLL